MKRVGTLYIANRHFKTHKLYLKVGGKLYDTKVKVTRLSALCLPEDKKNFIKNILKNFDRLVKQNKLREASNVFSGKPLSAEAVHFIGVRLVVNA